MDANQIQKTIKSWYALTKSTLPEIDSEEFGNFTRGIAGIVKSTLNYGRKHEGAFPIVSFSSEIPTAGCDIENRKIFMPTWYYSKEGLKQIGSDDIEPTSKSLACLNGSLCHEVLHLNHTTIAMRAVPANARDIFNIVEDIYIEHFAPPQFARFLEAKNSIYFTASKFEEAISRFAETKSLEDFANCFVFFKNGEFLTLANVRRIGGLKSIAFVDTLVKIFGIDDRRECHERLAYAKEIVAHFPGEESASSSPDYTSGTGEERKEGVEAQKAFKKAGGKKAEMAIAAASKASHAIRAEVESLKAKAETEEIEKGFARHMRSARIVELEQFGSYGSYAGGWTFDENLVDASFARYLKAIRTVNTAPGVAQPRGSMIVNTRLSRIASDGKIFSNRQVTDNRHGQMEVLIVMDMSGSTSNIVTTKSGKAAQIVELITSAGYSAFKALRAANIATTLFIHSGGDHPEIGRSLVYNMPGMKRSDEAFKKQVSKVACRQNYDGVVYEKLAGEFTKRIGKKVMIVLSDGVPEAPDYNGSAAAAHTREVCKKLRKDGIAVICLSVGSKWVADKNAAIYGSEWTIDAENDPQDAIRKIVAAL